MIELKIIHGKDAFGIRKKVFIEEQNIPKELEWDKMDKFAFHFVLYFDKVPIGTARLFEKDRVWYVGRMAILKEYRRKGYGKLIMENILNFLKSKNPSKIVIHAQVPVVDFYKKFGHAYSFFVLSWFVV